MYRLHSYLYIALIMVTWACNRPVPETTAKNKGIFNIKTDIRFGTSFYSIYLSNHGKGYVVKGKGSDYRESFIRIDTAEMSREFKFDSVYAVTQALQAIQRKPRLHIVNTRDSAHVEIYYNGKKIYDDFTMSPEFWKVYKPVLSDLPEGFNPFVHGAFQMSLLPKNKN